MWHLWALLTQGYRFKSQLLELERVSEGTWSGLLPGTDSIMTPLKWSKWERELAELQDREWVEFLVRGIRYGFRLCRDQMRGPVEGCKRYMCKVFLST